MKSLFWRTFWCLVPVALAGWITTVAVAKYYRGEPGGFKLGVDLVGGTILVYEIDFRKGLKDQEAGSADPQRDTNLLAASLKRRIDPNDLYNIVIRPAGGEGRVEIILPTGGKYREERAQQAWNELLEKLKEADPDLRQRHSAKLEIGRGKVQELADRIHLSKALDKWKESLFKKEADWKELWTHALEWWPELAVSEPPEAAAIRKKKFDSFQIGDFVKLGELLQRELSSLGTRISETDIEAWLKQEAWSKFLVRVREKKEWSELKNFKEEMDRIAPDATEQLTTFILARGNVVAQAGLATLAPLMGYDPVEEAEIKDFIDRNYGPSLQEITKKIDDLNKESGHSRDLTVEEVQRIKDLVSKVGNLEFRVLANSYDDADAIEKAKSQLNTTAEVTKNDWARQGKAPPGPVVEGTSKLAEFTLTKLARNQKSTVTYSWVELGPQQRQELNLDNAAKTDPARGTAWHEAFKSRNLADKLRIPGGITPRYYLQGALFYSRECKDSNLPETERRNKAVEYFVLCRNPEIDPATGTPTKTIDGDYLVSATGSSEQGRPTVLFSFNNTGAELFGNLTRKNVPSDQGPEGSQIRRHLAIILDGLVMSAPTVNSEIRNSGQITGTFTQREVDALVNILRAGALPASLKPQPVSESTMAATLGEDTVRSGVTAIGWAFVAVLGFMVFVYRFAGLVASVALLAQLILTVGFMVFVSATFTLPGIAGLVLTLGMAVDANVLIYERIREERDRGASLGVALRQGYDRAFAVIIDTHLSSIFTAVVLYVVGNDQLKGFGVSLTVGLIISLFTSLVMTRLMFDMWLARGWLKTLRMMRFFRNPNIDFMGLRHVFFTVTIVISILGIGLFIGRLPYDLNIDFVGGTAFGGQLTQPKNITELRQMLDDSEQKKRLNVVQVKELDTSKIDDPKAKDTKLQGGHYFEVTYPDPGNAQSKREILLANRADGATTAEREESVKQRSSKLPDFSVEQLFPGSLDPALVAENRSPYFTVRTSEREAELVQIAVDRLLSVEQGNKLVPLLKTKYLFRTPLSEKDTRLFFYQKNPEEYEKLTGDKFDPTKDQERPERTAADKDAPWTKEDMKKYAWPKEYASPSFFKTLLLRQLNKTFEVAEKTTLPFKVDLTGEGRTNQEGRYQALKVVFEPPLTASQKEKVDQALQQTEEEFRRRPQPELLENFDSQLAAETRVRALWAILASWGAVALYLWFRFGSWTFGLAAVLCLIHDLFFTMGVIAAAHYVFTWTPDLARVLGIEDFKLDLTAVAALLTLVGYSVNDTIVVFDRVREVRGKNPDLTPQMINDSVNQTLGRTLLTGVTTFLVVMVLYVWGGPGVHLFSFVILIGVMIGTYSSIYIASPLLLILGEGRRSERVERRPPPQPVGVTV